GLRDLIERFRGSGHAQAADSWVKTGPNQPLGSSEIEQAIGADALKTLSQQTGLSREELLARLTRDLPAAVDKFTPDGRLPTEDEAARLMTRQ
ncbi:MAG: YidB family protein, partial [Betaproteobacteria bacterium]